jgi:hypothetical protein
MSQAPIGPIKEPEPEENKDIDFDEYKISETEFFKLHQNI